MKTSPRLSHLISTLLISIFLLSIINACSENNAVNTQNQQGTHPTQWVPPQNATGQRLIEAPTQANFKISAAQWQPLTDQLVLSGTSNNNSERIVIKNTINGRLIASTIANKNLKWATTINSPEVVPCSVDIISESGTLTRAITDAPNDCDLLNRFKNTIASNNVNNNLSRSVSPLNIIYPEANIISPQTDLSISVNDTVNFKGAATNVSGAALFKWSFDGAVPSNTIQNPGNITFTKPGVYHVELEVTDSRGLEDPTPPMRMITVSDKNTVSPLTTQPIANIDTPVGDQMIMVGDTLNFTGSGSDPASPDPVTFMWNFAGIAPNSTLQNPGDITFNMAGVYTMTLAVSDAVGNIGINQIVVTVSDPTTTNLPPVGMITSPTGDITLNPGDSIFVEGQASDPDTADPTTLTYFWEFDGVTPDSTLQNPGMITYPDAGIFSIRLTATDSMGLSDPNPPTRVITVQAPTPVSSDAPNGEILTPAMDTTIMPGDSIAFTATGTALPSNEPLMYIWSFDGAAPNVTTMDTGPITFDAPGIYTVTLLVVDAKNQVDPTPAVRVITVETSSTPPPTMIPMVGHITIPETNVSILPGDAVSFTGFVDPEVNPPYTYLWLFDGAAPNGNDLMADNVVFSNPRSYSVMFFAIDKDGVFDSRPAIRTVTAIDTSIPPVMGPIASIIMPSSDTTIFLGESLIFDANVVDTSGNGTLTYLWTFDGAAPDDMMQTTNPITFDTAGTFTVTFTTTDTTTMLSSDPVSIMLTVTDPAATPPPTPAGPTAEIITLDGITTILAGDAITFTGYSGDATLDYLWTFDGVAPDSTDISPGPIAFDTAGQYAITFTVTDNTNPANPLSTTATVTIMVMPANAPASTQPNGFIVEPIGNQTITVGESIQFAGNGINPIDNDILNYIWDFDNGSSSTAQIPGSVTFNQVGVFTVTLIVNHDDKQTDNTPAEVTIIVNAASNPAP